MTCISVFKGWLTNWLVLSCDTLYSSSGKTNLTLIISYVNACTLPELNECSTSGHVSCMPACFAYQSVMHNQSVSHFLHAPLSRSTTGQDIDAYGRNLRRRPNVGAVGVDARLVSPASGPSASLSRRRRPAYAEGRRRRRWAVGVGKD